MNSRIDMNENQGIRSQVCCWTLTRSKQGIWRDTDATSLVVSHCRRLRWSVGQICLVAQQTARVMIPHRCRMTVCMDVCMSVCNLDAIPSRQLRPKILGCPQKATHWHTISPAVGWDSNNSIAFMHSLMQSFISCSPAFLHSLRSVI